MLQTLVNHIPSTLVHMMTGILVMDLIFNHKDDSRSDQFKVLAVGLAIVLTPDLPKLFGVVGTHSLFFVPFTGLMLALLTKRILPFSFLRRWTGILGVLLIGAFSIDFLGNGAHLLYPFVEKNLSFSIIKKDPWLSLILLLLTLFYVILPKYRPSIRRKPVLISGLLIIMTMLGVKTYTKVELEQILEARYSKQEVEKIVTKPMSGKGFKWQFQVHTPNRTIDGYTFTGAKELHIEK